MVGRRVGPKELKRMQRSSVRFHCLVSVKNYEHKLSIYSRELGWSTRWCLPFCRKGKVSEGLHLDREFVTNHQLDNLLTNVGRRVGRNVGKSVGTKVGPRVLIETKEEEVEILLAWKQKLNIQYSRFTHGSSVGDNVGPSDLKWKEQSIKCQYKWYPE